MNYSSQEANQRMWCEVDNGDDDKGVLEAPPEWAPAQSCPQYQVSGDNVRVCAIIQMQSAESFVHRTDGVSFHRLFMNP